MAGPEKFRKSQSDEIHNDIKWKRTLLVYNTS